MKKIISALFVGLVLSVSGVSLADNHEGHGKGHECEEGKKCDHDKNHKDHKKGHSH